jgi:cell division protein FtsZ
MLKNTIDGVEFICANTDAQALEKMDTRMNLQLGGAVTKGLGAGANPEVGRQAALEDRDRIREIISGADIFGVTAGRNPVGDRGTKSAHSGRPLVRCFIVGRSSGHFLSMRFRC